MSRIMSLISTVIISLIYRYYFNNTIVTSLINTVITSLINTLMYLLDLVYMLDE